MEKFNRGNFATGCAFEICLLLAGWLRMHEFAAQIVLTQFSVELF